MMVRWFIVLAAALLSSSCGGDDGDPPPVGGPGGGADSLPTTATGGSTAASAEGTTARTDTTTSTSTSTSGPSEVCRACWSGACSDTVDACFGDEACACRLACDSDATCITACDDSPVFDQVVDCIFDSTFGPFVEECDAMCGACLVGKCEAPWASCMSEQTCICRVWCRESENCDEVCGVAPPSFEAVTACFVDANLACADQC